MKEAPAHDTYFKELFGRPWMAAGLVRFLRIAGIPGLDVDEASLELLPNCFVSEEMREMRSDTVWRARWRNHPDHHAYLHLEFQARPERRMVVRTSSYQDMLVRSLAARGEIPANARWMPVVVSVVLYSGRRPWKSPTEMSPLLPPWARSLATWRDGRFFLVDFLRVPAEWLADADNPFVLAILLERTGSLEDMAAFMTMAAERLSGAAEDGRWLLRLFRMRLIRSRHLMPSDFPMHLFFRKEDDPMFERRFAEMVREHRNAALAEGIEIGEARGIEIGEARGIEIGEARGGDKRSRDIAIQLLRMGLPLGQVAEATRLSLEEVARLELELRGDGSLDG